MPSGHPPGPSSIIVGNCIACNGLVRVSSTANANSSVRCPHCQETFSLLSLLESAAPEVEVVHAQAAAPAKKKELYIDQTTDTAKDASGKFVVPSQLAKGARRRKSSRRRSSSSTSSSSSRSGESDRSSRRDYDSQSHRDASYSARRNESHVEQLDEPTRRRRPSENSARHAAPPRAESNSRPQEYREYSSGPADNSEDSQHSHRSTRHRDARAEEALKDQPNPVVDFLKVIAGACLALPIAYLIVMWMFSKDPLGIGEGLGERVPFLVPAALRAEDDSDGNGETPSAVGQSFLGDDDEEENLLDSGFESLDVGGEALKELDLDL